MNRMVEIVFAGAVGAAFATPITLVASSVSVSHTFSNGTVADADEVNANFSDVKTAVDDNDSRLSALEATVSGLQLSGSGIVEPTRFSCVPSDWSYASSSTNPTTLCTATVTLAHRSLVFANYTGHYNSGSSSNWCIAEILFPSEPAYPTSGSPYNQRHAPHHYVSSWSDLSYARSTVLDAGTHDIAISVTGNGTCTMNGAALHGWAIAIAE
jgi:hypothetical protein